MAKAELKVDSQGDERANRRVTVRLITPLMRVAVTIWRPSSRGIDSILPVAHIAGDPVQQLQPELLVRHLAAAKAQRHLHLVALFEELQHRAHLDLIIMIVGTGTELDFLDLDDLLLLACLGLALLLSRT
jgi:hypothetical protein